MANLLNCDVIFALNQIFEKYFATLQNKTKINTSIFANSKILNDGVFIRSRNTARTKTTC